MNPCCEQTLRFLLKLLEGTDEEYIDDAFVKGLLREALGEKEAAYEAEARAEELRKGLGVEP